MIRSSLLAVTGWLDKFPQSLLSLFARIFPAAVFWRSGETKVAPTVGDTFNAYWSALFSGSGEIKFEGFHLSDSAVDLFRDEYRLPFIDPEIAAKIAAMNEHLFPFLLVLGLASRLSALALLVMTSVIEIFVYPDAWPEHGLWATCFLIVITRGPGVFSLDHLLTKSWLGKSRPN
ncbi:MAG TPA: DoxX family protein [Methylocella sp.]|nr:DoxX family protein [Methylocella sp.]